MNKMTKEKVKDVFFNKTPNVQIRVIADNDSEQVKKDKKKYPFELIDEVLVTVVTDKRVFSFIIPKGYTWNGADIPRFCWRLVGSRTDNDFLIASMIHDYILEFKTFIQKEILKEELSTKEYRRLTSLIFRQKLKDAEVGTIKANVMSYFVDVFQMINFKGWEND